MASVWYPLALEAAIEGDLDFDTMDVRALLIDDADYTFTNTHDFLDDVAAGARVGTATALAGLTTTTSTNVVTVDANNTTMSAVTGDESEAVILYDHTGTDSTSRLLFYLELTASVTPNGGDITLQWNASGLGTITATGA